MSRIAKRPIIIPTSVFVDLKSKELIIKGVKGVLKFLLHDNIDVIHEKDSLLISYKENSKKTIAIAGTTRSIVYNMVFGVTHGFKKTLLLQGVGYRVSLKERVLDLVLGYSHAINYKIPEDIDVECPNQTTIVIHGLDKQKVGQVAADIRAFRPPEPYKGKGVRYSDELVRRKETKKK
jgi:large subunit ribosomal protein L6